jgi:hypothetical protein
MTRSPSTLSRMVNPRHLVFMSSQRSPALRPGLRRSAAAFAGRRLWGVADVAHGGKPCGKLLFRKSASCFTPALPNASRAGGSWQGSAGQHWRIFRLFCAPAKKAFRQRHASRAGVGRVCASRAAHASITGAVRSRSASHQRMQRPGHGHATATGATLGSLATGTCTSFTWSCIVASPQCGRRASRYTAHTSPTVTACTAAAAFAAALSAFRRAKGGQRGFVKAAQDELALAGVGVDVAHGVDAGHAGGEGGGVHHQLLALQARPQSAMGPRRGERPRRTSSRSSGRRSWCLRAWSAAARSGAPLFFHDARPRRWRPRCGRHRAGPAACQQGGRGVEHIAAVQQGGVAGRRASGAVAQAMALHGGFVAAVHHHALALRLALSSRR